MSLPRRSRPWLALLAVQVLLGAVALTWALSERARIESLEFDRLGSQARVIDVNLGRALRATAHSLSVVAGLAAGLHGQPAAPDSVAMRTLRDMEAAMPTVRTFILTNAAGQALASNRPELIGQDFSARAYVQGPRAQPMAESLFVSPPFQSVLGVYVMALSRPVRDAHGALVGVAVAVIDPADLGLLLDSVRYSPDVQAELVHGLGSLFVQRPARAQASLDRAPPGSRLATHLAGGQPVTRERAWLQTTADERLVVMRTLTLDDLRLQHPLVAVLHRPWAGVTADWNAKLRWGGALYALACAGSALGLLRYLHLRAQRLVDAKRLKLATDASGMGIWEFDLVTKCYHWDTRMFSLFGLDPRNVSSRLDDWQRMLSQDDLARMRGATRDTIRSDRPFDLTFAIHRPDGKVRHMRNRAALYADESGVPRRLIGATEDVTERRRLEADMRVAAVAFESSHAMLVTNAAVEVLRINRAFTRLFGYASADVLQRNPRLFKSGRHDAAFYTAMWAGLSQHGHWEGEVWNTCASGTELACWVVITAVSDDTGTVSHYVATYTDITERKASEDEARRLAFYDPLTQLPNRRLLHDRLNQTLTRARRDKTRAALIFVDLDKFKPVNDSYGHAAGDHLLQTVAARLRTCVRESDTVARIGGDEFVVLIEAVTQNADAVRVAEKIHAALLEAVPLPSGQRVFVSSSAGVALYPDDGADADTLSHHADVAMYAAKSAGRDQYVLYRPDLPDAPALTDAAPRPVAEPPVLPLTERPISP